MEEEPKIIKVIIPYVEGEDNKKNQKEILDNFANEVNNRQIQLVVEYELPPKQTPNGPLTDLTLTDEEQERLIDSIVNEDIEGKKVCLDQNNCELLFKFTEEDYKELKEMGIITGGKKKKRSKKRKSLKKKRKTKKKVVKKKATKKKTKKGKK
jgi:hypothetical protein